MRNSLAGDLDHVLAHTEGLWDDLRGQRIFITGGTGFFGCWLLESFLWANDKLGLNASAVVLTRKGQAFRMKAPHLADHPAVALHAGEIRTFEFPAGAFSYVIHAATESSTTLNDDDPLAMFESIVSGTRRTLDFARRSGAMRFLLTSSGAVYGRQPPDVTHIPEDFTGAPEPAVARSAYAEAKRAAETLCAAYAHQHGVHATIARCFAFVGPYLPLDVHFAIGNFIRDALGGGPIRITGDGTPYRSYLYAADLAIWLWTILLRAEPMRPYNVGSEAAISIADLGRLVARQFTDEIPVQIAMSAAVGAPAARYVPSTTRARTDLGVATTVDLEQGLLRTVDWYRRRLSSPNVN